MNLVERAKGIMFKPAQTWETIKAEETTIKDLFTSYAAILAIIPAAAGFIGMSLVGTSMLGIRFRIPFLYGIVHAIISYVLTLVGVYVVAFVIDALAPSFGSRKDILSAVKVAVFFLYVGLDRRNLHDSANSLHSYISGLALRLVSSVYGPAHPYGDAQGENPGILRCRYNRQYCRFPDHQRPCPPCAPLGTDDDAVGSSPVTIRRVFILDRVSLLIDLSSHSDVKITMAF